MTPAAWANPRIAGCRVGQGGYDRRALKEALACVAIELGWSTDPERPFESIIAPGARVLIKPNWVLHENQGSGGMEPLVTHAALIREATDAALASGAGRVVVGDAPLQSCDFNVLLARTGIGDWAASLSSSEPRFGGVRDFRRTTCVMRDGVRTSFEDLRPEEDFVLFDLGTESLLEPISAGNPEFRVTQYDPRLLADRHRAGRHQYLIAREAIAADLIINLPKLKTHKKAGVTCALKNLIGINGNKEFLPHHRVGGGEDGGDCYPGRGRARRALEMAFDRFNMASRTSTAHAWHAATRVLSRVSRFVDGSAEIEGAWHGNDTIWRTCLDLNRVLLYGRLDGSMADEPQREEIHIVDAIIAGQGDGPLAPEPLQLGMLIAGGNAAAVDRIGAMLLKYDPGRIPIVREAFGRFSWPLTSYGPEETSFVMVSTGSREAVTAPWDILEGPVAHPEGWREAAISAMQPS
jgi:uncharacterized protein (DUF362 family)